MRILDHAGHESQLTKRKRRRLRSLEFLPTIVTLGNLLCGFAAIHFGLRAMYELGAGSGPEPIEVLRRFRVLERMLPSFLSVGAGLVVLGMILDCFDGLIARVTRSTTNFGGQLDSLADVITFGAAPAILSIAFMTKELASDQVFPSPLSEHFLGRAAWIASAMYVAFAAIRLARFNVEHAESGFDYRTFRGLPSPGAAALVVALILFHDQAISEGVGTLVVYTMPVAVLAAAFLMVSRIPYRRLTRGFLLGRQPFGRVLVLVLVIALFIAYKAPTLLALVVAYVFSGPVLGLLRVAHGKSKLTIGEPAPATDHPPETQRSQL